MNREQLTPEQMNNNQTKTISSNTEAIQHKDNSGTNQQTRFSNNEEARSAVLHKSDRENQEINK